ncbi:MepB family protein [Jeotgalibaca ciconiae]|uniref:MepB protein n=1 Tax=Jeotgalibaca ciconiae TaxID=2496265 RepID=A0A3Q9BIL2_9LACT|nr:MepB family protein [Jeotgalibaca ciconiae]AZP03205.1 hypothetical protein EJN90_00160 [Jeotgalibaca ciconiae]AZP05608.1 hypothetical protein EJN90_13735 [Jeotgalibaca ciconiae]
MDSTGVLKRMFGEFELSRLEEWNKDYEGIIFNTNDSRLTVRSRLAKKTPKKAVYFVSFWEKNESGNNVAFKYDNSPELLAIVIIDLNRQGIFLLDKDVCVKRNILSNEKQSGKMAMRFYPPWCSRLNATAQKTQAWQLNYFKDYSK